MRKTCGTVMRGDRQVMFGLTCPPIFCAFLWDMFENRARRVTVKTNNGPSELADFDSPMKDMADSESHMINNVQEYDCSDIYVNTLNVINTISERNNDGFAECFLPRLFFTSTMGTVMSSSISNTLILI